MSITSALYTGVSGLIGNSEALNVIGNNISNVNTTGFKSSRSVFADLLSLNQGASSQIGTGTELQTVQNLFTQGTSQASANVTDLTIQGNAFFALQSPDVPATTQNTAFLTRSGSFTVNDKLQLVNPDGYQVLDTSGKPIQFVNSGVNPSTDFGKVVSIDSTGLITYLATDGVTLNYYNSSNGLAGPNLADTSYSAISTANDQFTQASAAYQAAATAATNYTTATQNLAADPNNSVLIAAQTTALNTLNTANEAAVTALNSLATAAAAATTAADNASAANSTDAKLTAAKTAADTFFTAGSPPTGDVGTLLANAQAAAAVTDGTGPALLASDLGTFTGTNPTAGPAFDIASALNNATGAASVASTTAASRSVTAGNANTVQRIALVTATDPTALEKVGGSMYRATASSGVATTGFSLANNTANGTSNTLISNSLEASNVDMATEFVNMITTQRAYSANAKTITTADEMTQDVLGLIR